MFARQTARRVASRRRGNAVVEFAICLPVLVVLVVGALECTSMTFLKQSLNVVAYEAIRDAIRHDGTTATATQRANEVIAERDLVGCTIRFEPSEVGGLDSGEPVRAIVSAPCGRNSLLPLKLFAGNLEAAAFMIKE